MLSVSNLSIQFGKRVLFDDVNTSDLQKALSLGKQLKSPEVAQATQDLHGKVVNKIRDVTSKLS